MTARALAGVLPAAAIRVYWRDALTTFTDYCRHSMFPNPAFWLHILSELTSSVFTLTIIWRKSRESCSLIRLLPRSGSTLQPNSAGGCGVLLFSTALPGCWHFLVLRASACGCFYAGGTNLPVRFPVTSRRCGAFAAR